MSIEAASSRGVEWTRHRLERQELFAGTPAEGYGTNSTGHPVISVVVAESSIGMKKAVLRTALLMTVGTIKYLKLLEALNAVFVEKRVEVGSI